jgi:hypothetical protein
MADVVFVAIALAFFALCFLYVLALDKLLGRDSSSSDSSSGSGEQRVGAEVTVR